MFCSKCGKENGDDAKFCSSCGNSFKSSAEKTAEEKAQEIKQKSKESASTLFYLIKPLLKLKVVAPILVVVFTVIFWDDMASAYENYKYEKAQEERLAKKQAWLNKYQKEGIFADYGTKLVWQDDYSAKTTEKNWNDAIKHCQNLKFAGYSDWRLPTYDELKKLYPQKNNLKNVASDLYWSSSGHADDSSDAWAVYFGSGNTGYDNKSFENYVRCVRGRQ